MKNNIQVKRAYDDVEKSDGCRVLVDRLWPRGVSKEKAQIDMWEKEIAPSNKLRSWFHKDQEKRLAEFSEKYEAELKDTTALKTFKEQIKDKKVITLVTAVKDIEHSHIPTLLKYLS